MGRSKIRTVCAISAFLIGPLACQAAPRTPRQTRVAPRAPQGKVAVIRLEGRLFDTKGFEAAVAENALILKDVLARLDKASRDKKVGSLLLDVRTLSAGWAQLAEVRSAIQRFRSHGKNVFAWVQSPDNKTLYLASAANWVAIPPGSTVWALGLRLEMLFLKGLLDKIGVRADILRMGRYKGAAEQFTRESMSKDLKESLQALVDSIYDHYVQTVAKGRHRKAAWFEDLVNQGPIPATKAASDGLVDAVADFTQVVHELGGRQKVFFDYGVKKEKPSLAKLLRLLQGKSPVPAIHEPHVAVVVAKGPIVLGSPPDDLFSFQDVIASNRMIDVLEKLRHNQDVKAVVLRINSPGGSAEASELIWQAIRRLGSAKPVVVSMGNVAASGGYYIASAARKIYAEPATITGSIGVFGGKLVLQGLFHKVGLSVDWVEHGRRAGLLSSSRPFSPEERAAIQGMLRRTYELFVERVAKGRKLSKAVVLKAAEGRVWSGLDALRARLVDRIGGLVDAVSEAKRLGHLPKDAPVGYYPRPKNVLQILTERLGGAKVLAGASATIEGLLTLALAPSQKSQLLTTVLALWGLRAERVVLLAPWPMAIR